MDFKTNISRKTPLFFSLRLTPVNRSSIRAKIRNDYIFSSTKRVVLREAKSTILSWYYNLFENFLNVCLLKHHFHQAWFKNCMVVVDDANFLFSCAFESNISTLMRLLNFGSFMEEALVVVAAEANGLLLTLFKAIVFNQS